MKATIDTLNLTNVSRLPIQHSRKSVKAIPIVCTPAHLKNSTADHYILSDLC